MFDKKDEIVIKGKFLEEYSHVKNLISLNKLDGRKSKVGRVISVVDGFLQVDFWDSIPSKFSVDIKHAQLVKKADASTKEAVGIGNIITNNHEKALLVNEAAKVFKKPTEDVKKVQKSNNKKADRFNEGKLPMHLVPPDAIKAMAAVLEVGAKKYALRNWEKGADFSVPYSSLMRHLMLFWEGEDVDSESKLPHLYHVLMNAAMLVRYSEKFPELDDRPNKEIIKNEN